MQTFMDEPAVVRIGKGEGGDVRKGGGFYVS